MIVLGMEFRVGEGVGDVTKFHHGMICSVDSLSLVSAVVDKIEGALVLQYKSVWLTWSRETGPVYLDPSRTWDDQVKASYCVVHLVHPSAWSHAAAA